MRWPWRAGQGAAANGPRGPAMGGGVKRSFRRRQAVETDILIVGSGITAALVAERLAEDRDARVTVVEAGDDTTALADRPARRQRFLDYGENPWVDDHIDGYDVDGIQSRSMCVGGLAMHWGGVTPRYSPEDFRVRSLYGVGDDWPISYDELDTYYQQAEERMGVAGEQGPPELDPRGRPYPQPALPLSYNLAQLREWAARADIPFWSQPSAKNAVPYRGRPQCCRNDTCSPICPIGAKYSPDFTWDALLEAGRVDLVKRTLVRRLVRDPATNRITHAIGASFDAPDEPIEFHARTVVIAGGYVWSSHLLLLSADGAFPDGLANSSGLVGKYMAGHRNVNGYVRVPMRLYPGMNGQHSLVTKRFMRPGPLDSYMRHDLRLWESSYGSGPRLRDHTGALLLGDALMDDWRAQVGEQPGVARIRAYYDVLPARASEITLDGSNRNAWGDPLPTLSFRDSPESAELRAPTEQAIRSLFERIVAAAGGEVLTARPSGFQDHPSGGCRMGDDPATSVVDGFGRSHDHENLFVVGAPTCVTGGCANSTLTFAALGLRAADAIGEAFPARAPDGQGAALHDNRDVSLPARTSNDDRLTLHDNRTVSLPARASNATTAK